MLLEPIMECEVITPEDYVGSVIADLNARGGRVLDLSHKQTGQVIKAQAPLARLFGYSTALRSLTQGRANFSLKFSTYEPVIGAALQEFKQRHGILL
jgi:elongation factor G